MAEKEIVFKTRVKTNNSKKSVDDLNKSFKNTQKEANKVGTDSASQLAKLNKQVKSGTMDQQQLTKAVKDYQTIAINAGEKSPVGRKAIKDAANLKDRLDKLNQTVNANANDGRKMQAAMQLGGSLVAGYGIAQGSMAMLGVESEDLQKTFVKLQAATAVMNGLEQIRTALVKEGALMQTFYNTKTKIATGLTAAYATVTGTATGALKLFRLALVATGIGAIIVGIGLLIANFEAVSKWIKKVGEMIMSFFKPQIDIVIDALQFLGIVEDDAALAAKERAKEEDKLQKKRIENIQEDIKKREEKMSQMEKEHQKYSDDANFELRMMKAQGKSKEEILAREKEIRKQTIKNNQARIEELITINEQYLATFKLKKLQGELTNEEGEEIKSKIRENISAIKGLVKTNRDVNNDIKIQDAETKQEIKDSDDQFYKDRKKAREKAEKERQAEEAEANKKRLQRQQLVEDLMIESIEDANLRKIMALEIQHEREEQKIIEKYGKESKVLEELEKTQAVELENLQEEIRKNKEAKKTEKEKKSAEAARQRRKAQLELQLIEMREDFEAQQAVKAELAQLEMEKELEDETLLEEQKLLIKEQYAQKIRDIDEETKNRQIENQNDIIAATEEMQKASLNSIQNLSDTVFTIASNRRGKSEKEEEKLAKRQFKINKALQLSGAIMDAKKSITASLAQSPIAIGAIPNPAGIASLAFAATTSASNIASILSTKFEGNGGGGSNISAPNVSTSRVENAEDDRTVTDTESLINSESNNETNTKVSIVDSEIKASIKDTDKVSIISNIG